MTIRFLPLGRVWATDVASGAAGATAKGDARPVVSQRKSHIAESAKPGIYARARRVLYAENLSAALVAAAALALLVNVVELLCTAGLPAVYTAILARQELSTAGHYGYLALYNLAYIADDSLMVAIAVITLGRRKLQEKQGRWLKLLSGAVMLALSLGLLLFPGMFAV